MRLGVLREIDADQRAIEQLVGESARGLRLAHSGGTAKEEGRERPLRGKPGIVAPHGPGDRGNVVLVSHDPGGKAPFEA